MYLQLEFNKIVSQFISCSSFQPEVSKPNVTDFEHQLELIIQRF